MDWCSIGAGASCIRRILSKDKLRLVFLFLMLFPGASIRDALAQSGLPTPSPSPSPVPSHKPSLERHFFTNVLKDQYGIWTAPLRFRRNDLRWFLPLGAAAAGMFVTDEQTAGSLDNNSTRLNVSHGISQMGTGYAVGGAAVSIYLVGRATHNAKARETGVLALEALIDSGIVTQVFKSVTQRPRPLERNGEGNFFTDGSSFISGHSSSIWSLAAVIDDEYGRRNPWVRYGMFGLATAVSASRYTGRNHFLSDVLLGSAIGYGVGHFVYLRHHDPSLDERPDITRPVTKLERYFPRITTARNSRTRTFEATMTWNF